MSYVPITNQERVDERTHTNLKWDDRPKGTWLNQEMIQSDAYRSLTKTESDIWMFIQLRKNYPKGKKKLCYWKPSNRDNFRLPEVAILDFFDGPAKEMSYSAPSRESIRRSFMKFMAVGFLSLRHQGGNGQGDVNIYQLENNWRLWKVGDPPCFTKAGMSREKGFIRPGSREFNTSPLENRKKRGASASDKLTREF